MTQAVSMRARKYDTISKPEEIDYVKRWITSFTLDSYDIKFSRPTYKDNYIIVNLTRNKEYGEYPGDGDEQITQNLLDYYTEFQKLSIDVSHSRLITPVNMVQGHTIDSLYLGLAPSPSTEDDISIALNEKAITEDVKIIVNS